MKVKITMKREKLDATCPVGWYEFDLTVPGINLPGNRRAGWWNCNDLYGDMACTYRIDNRASNFVGPLVEATGATPADVKKLENVIHELCDLANVAKESRPREYEEPAEYSLGTRVAWLREYLTKQKSLQEQLEKTEVSLGRIVQAAIDAGWDQIGPLEAFIAKLAVGDLTRHKFFAANCKEGGCQFLSQAYEIQAAEKRADDAEALARGCEINLGTRVKELEDQLHSACEEIKAERERSQAVHSWCSIDEANKWPEGSHVLECILRDNGTVFEYRATTIWKPNRGRGHSRPSCYALISAPELPSLKTARDTFLAINRAQTAEARVKELTEENKRLDKTICELEMDLDAARKRCHYAEMRVKELETAIRTHWEQKADDRCWEDDSKLYSVVPLPETTARCIGDPEVMLENCKRFIKQRMCAGGPWKSYAELEAENAKLHEQIRHATEALEACYTSANPGSNAPLSVLATWAGNEIAELRERCHYAETAIKDLYNWGCSEAAFWFGRNVFQMQKALNKIEGVQSKLSQKSHSENENNKLRKRVEELEAILKTTTRVIEDDYS